MPVDVVKRYIMGSSLDGFKGDVYASMVVRRVLFFCCLDGFSPGNGTSC